MLSCIFEPEWLLYSANTGSKAALAFTGNLHHDSRKGVFWTIKRYILCAWCCDRQLMLQQCLHNHGCKNDYAATALFLKYFKIKRSLYHPIPICPSIWHALKTWGCFIKHMGNSFQSWRLIQNSPSASLFYLQETYILTSPCVRRGSWECTSLAGHGAWVFMQHFWSFLHTVTCVLGCGFMFIIRKKKDFKNIWRLNEFH